MTRCGNGSAERYAAVCSRASSFKRPCAIRCVVILREKSRSSRMRRSSSRVAARRSCVSRSAANVRITGSRRLQLGNMRRELYT